MTEAIQEQVIAVYTTQLTTQLNQLTSDYDKTLIGKTERQLATGQATELDLLTAQKTSKDADIALTSAQAAEVKAKQSLLVNLGWAYNATPTICAVPDVADAMINSIDLTADTTKALGNSFQLQVDERKQNVSVSDSSIAQMALTVDNDKNQVQSDIMSAYNALINAKNEYAKAQLQASNSMKRWHRRSVRLQRVRLRNVSLKQPSITLLRRRSIQHFRSMHSRSHILAI